MSSFDRRSLNFFIVSLMLTLAFYSFHKIQWVGSLYGDQGILPLADTILSCRMSKDTFCLTPYSLFAIFDSNLGTSVLLGLLGSLALLVAWGFRSPWLFVFILILELSWKTRYFLSFHGGDFLLTWLLIVAAFFPYRRSTEKHGAMALYTCFVITFYVFNGLTKNGLAWREGLAVSHALQFDFMATHLGNWLLGFPKLTIFLTYFTRYFELFGAFFYLVPIRFQKFRIGVALSFILFHFGIELSLATFPLGALCFALHILFMPPLFWDTLNRWLKLDFLWKWRPFSTPLNVSSSPLWTRISLIFFASLCLAFTLAQGAYFEKIKENYPLVRVVYLALTNVGASPVSAFFAPNPAHKTGWIVIVGKTSTGEDKQVDLIEEKLRSPVSYEKPEIQEGIYKHRIWSKVFLKISQTDSWPLPLGMLTRQICKKFPELVQVEIYYFARVLPPHTEIRNDYYKFILSNRSCKKAISPEP